jgi:hypothetical protein
MKKLLHFAYACIISAFGYYQNMTNTPEGSGGRGGLYGYSVVELTKGQLIGERPEESLARLSNSQQELILARQALLKAQVEVDAQVDEVIDVLKTLPLGTVITVYCTETGHQIESYSKNNGAATGFFKDGVGFRGYIGPTASDRIEIFNSSDFIILDPSGLGTDYRLEAELQTLVTSLDN